MNEKSIKWLKISVIVISSLIMVYFVGRYGVALYSEYSDKLISYTVNNENCERHILVATQKTKFKDNIMHEMINQYDKKNVYISVIDVRELPNINADKWDKIIIFSAIKMYKYHSGIETFLQNINSNNKNKVFMFNTSESTIIKYDGIDSITSASKNQQEVILKMKQIINMQ